MHLKNLVLSLMITTTLLGVNQIAYGAMSLDEINSRIASVQTEIADCENDMEHAHIMADSARDLDIAENDSIIETAKDIYSESSSRRKELIDELDSLTLQKQQRTVYVGEFKLTGYCPCKECSEGFGYLTSSGAMALEGVTVAADRSIIPQGTRVYIEGVGERTVQDVGGAIKGNKIDIFVNSHSNCYNPQYNQTNAKVYIIK